jgi:hypothetical protein
MKKKIDFQCLAVNWNINSKHTHRIAVPYVSAANVLEVTARPIPSFFKAIMFTLPPHYPIFPCS